MLKFRFAGDLQRFFGERILTLDVETPGQGLRLLMAQNPAFKKELLTRPISIRLSGKSVKDDECNYHMNRHVKPNSTVAIVPVVQGAGLSAVAIMGIVSLVVTVAGTAYAFISMRNMKAQNAAEANQNGSIQNNSFTSAENREGQGRPVPILLGEMLIGSNVISLGIDTTNNPNAIDQVS